MFEAGELRILEQRRRDLLAQCETQRRQLALEVNTLRLATSWVDVGSGWLRKARPALLVLAPLAGFWLIRKATGRPTGGASGLLEKVATGVALYQRVRSLWGQFTKPPTGH